jgi:hypothetical protein
VAAVAHMVAYADRATGTAILRINSGVDADRGVANWTGDAGWVGTPPGTQGRTANRVAASGRALGTVVPARTVRVLCR